jgi:CRISPR-associated protein Csm2
MAYNTNNFKTNWVSERLDDAAITFAEDFGQHLCDLQQGRPGRMALTTSQIRNFFGEVKRIQARGFEKQRTSFLLIRPKLAYAEARVLAKNRDSRISDFRKVMELAHGAVRTEPQFQNFVDFLEATLAYHKFYGGRDQ